ncbi:unnamed protein product [Calypogeia fissa]
MARAEAKVIAMMLLLSAAVMGVAMDENFIVGGETGWVDPHSDLSPPAPDPHHVGHPPMGLIPDPENWMGHPPMGPIQDPHHMGDPPLPGPIPSVPGPDAPEPVVAPGPDAREPDAREPDAPGPDASTPDAPAPDAPELVAPGPGSLT